MRIDEALFWGSLNLRYQKGIGDVEERVVNKELNVVHYYNYLFLISHICVVVENVVVVDQVELALHL